MSGVLLVLPDFVHKPRGFSAKALAAAVTAGAVAFVGAPQAASAATAKATPAKPTLTVTPKTKLAPSRKSVTVTGKGFSASRNAGLGVYVVFGPKGSKPWLNANAFYSAKWVHPGATPSSGQARMTAKGAFSTTVPVSATFTDGNGKKVNCKKVACYVMTFAAHGMPDRSQDTAVRVTFK
jgi:hypothetical protein